MLSMERRDWFRHVDAQHRSGLSVKRYCKEHGLSAANFGGRTFKHLLKVARLNPMSSQVLI